MQLDDVIYFVNWDTSFQKGRVIFEVLCLLLKKINFNKFNKSINLIISLTKINLNNQIKGLCKVSDLPMRYDCLKLALKRFYKEKLEKLFFKNKYIGKKIKEIGPMEHSYRDLSFLMSNISSFLG